MIEFEGFDELNRKLNDLAEKSESMHGIHEVPLGQLLNPSFLAKHTRFLSEDEMFEASGFKVQTSEDFEKIPDQEWNEFICQNTPFATWDDMISAAVTDWTHKKLGLDDNEP